MKNPIFIVGLRRSGSTLWLNIFAQHPEIYRMGEMFYLNQWRKDFRFFLRHTVGDLSNENNIDKMIEAMFSRRLEPGLANPFWFYDIEKVNNNEFKTVLRNRLMKSNKSLESIFKIIIEEITEFKGCGRCCMKFPVSVNYVPKLLEWYPECKIIHITRDPRAIAISKTNDPGGTKIRMQKHPHLRFAIRQMMINYVILEYMWTSKLHSKYKGIKNYALFKFEDLVAEPEKTIRRLCEFTEIDFIPEMLYPKAGQASSVTGKTSEGFNKKAAKHWKESIHPYEEKFITSMTLNSMKRFEYDPHIHPVFQ